MLLQTAYNNIGNEDEIHTYLSNEINLRERAIQQITSKRALKNANSKEPGGDYTVMSLCNRSKESNTVEQKFRPDSKTKTDVFSDAAENGSACLHLLSPPVMSTDDNMV